MAFSKIARKERFCEIRMQSQSLAREKKGNKGKKRKERDLRLRAGSHARKEDAGQETRRRPTLRGSIEKLDINHQKEEKVRMIE
jgi:hypothetical protein